MNSSRHVTRAHLLVRAAGSRRRRCRRLGGSGGATARPGTRASPARRVRSRPGGGARRPPSAGCSPPAARGPGAAPTSLRPVRHDGHDPGARAAASRSGGSPPTRAGTATAPGPVLVVKEGDTVTVRLHNQLTQSMSRSRSPGSPPVSSPPGSTTSTSGADPGGTATYTFHAGRPGTFLYEAGHTPGGARQVAMGLAGALVVLRRGRQGRRPDLRRRGRAGAQRDRPAAERRTRHASTCATSRPATGWSTAGRSPAPTRFPRTRATRSCCATSTRAPRPTR